MIGKRSTTAVVEEVEEAPEALAPEVEVPDEAETLEATEAADIDEPEVAEARPETADDGDRASTRPTIRWRRPGRSSPPRRGSSPTPGCRPSASRSSSSPTSRSRRRPSRTPPASTPKRIRAAMGELAGHYREGVSGIVLHEVSTGWQLRTCPTSAEFVRRFLQVKPQRLTRAALETLAIVAYRQPVTRPEVEEIRGVDCGAVMKALLERGLLEVLGKKEEPGRPLLYGTTRAFLEFFNLKDLASLPTLREFHELNEEHQRIVEDSYPDAAGPGDAEQPTEPTGILDGIEPMTADDNRPEDEAALEALDAAVKDTEEKARVVAEALDGQQGAGRHGRRVTTPRRRPRHDGDRGAAPEGPGPERGSPRAGPRSSSSSPGGYR